MNADVSVLILSHNAAAYIGDAIDSVLGQTGGVREVLVVDDSTDGSPAIVEGYERNSSGLVKLVRVEPCNVSAARNHVLEMASGRYIAFLDADDIWLPEKTARQVALLEGDAGAVGAFAPYFDFATELDDRDRRVPKPGVDDPSIGDVLFDQNIASSTFLARRESIGEIRFDENAPHGEDTVFVSNLRLVGRWRKVDEALIAKRLHESQASSGLRHVIANYRTRLEWVRGHRAGLGDAGVAELEEGLASRFIWMLESRYWQREFEGMKELCAAAAEMFPEAYARSELSGAKLYPRWVYRLKDLITSGS